MSYSDSGGSEIRWEICGGDSSYSMKEFVASSKFSIFLAAVGRKIRSKIDPDKAKAATDAWLNKQKDFIVGSSISKSPSLLDFKYFVFSFWGPPDDFDVNSLTIYFDDY